MAFHIMVMLAVQPHREPTPDLLPMPWLWAAGFTCMFCGVGGNWSTEKTHVNMGRTYILQTERYAPPPGFEPRTFLL